MTHLEDYAESFREGWRYVARYHLVAVVLGAEREEAASELPLSCLRPDGTLAEYVIDRSYVEDGIRWVVDYKSSVPDSGQSVAEFIAEQEQRYRAQLDDYRRLLEAHDGREVRCALYFTSLPLWHELRHESG